MKYCINYINNEKLFDKVDEIIIKIEDEYQLKLVKDVLDSHPNKIFILDCTKSYDCSSINIDKLINFFNDLADTHRTNFKVKIFNIFYESFYEKYPPESLKFPYFFNSFLKDWDGFDIYIRNLNQYKYTPTDVYIAENLGFNLKQVKDFLPAGIQVRIFPNIAQARNINPTNPLVSFFVRPEDVPVLENYIDVLDFTFCYNNNNKNITKTLLNIYQRGYYHGNLDELIIFPSEYSVPVSNDIINNYDFCARRVKCGRECLKEKNPRCSICKRLFNLNISMNEVSETIKTINEKLGTDITKD